MSFADLHHGDRPLVLPNAWDVGSALAMLAAGFAAVGTTSLGVAVSHGLADATRATRDATYTLARALADLPCWVSVDAEDGFDDNPDRVAAYVERLGVDGVNLEDSTGGALVEPDRHAAKVGAVKERCPEVFVNARIDTFWLGQEDLPATLARAACYVAAGADGVFVPGRLDAETIRAVADAVPVPLNVLAGPAYGIERLAELGVRRISTGSLPYRAALDAAVGVGRAVREGQPVLDATPYSVVQRRVAGRSAG